MFPALPHDPRVLRFVPRPAARAASARRARFRQRVLILGRTPLAERIVQEVDARPFGRRTVVAVVEEGSPGPLRDVIAELKPDVIVVALVERRGRTPVAALLDSCVPQGVAVEEAGEFYERITGKLAVESLRPTSILFSHGFRPSRAHRLFSRLLTFLAALVGLVLAAPLMALIALAIKLESPGPVLFRQDRAGLHRRPFTLLKFRTMRHGGEAPRSEWAGDNGDRITRVGRWLRHLRLDELPQFINMLRGEMNLVGPRPHPVSNLGLFTLVARNLNDLPGASIGYYQLRSVVPPGLTGWAQVRYGYANNLEEEIEKLRFDLYYVKHASPWLDLRILARTAMNLVAGRLRDGSARAALLALLALAAAVPAPAQPAVATNSAAAAVPDDYVIGPEDVLDVAVWNNTSISRTVPVRPDGRISLPLINDVQAAGLTPTQLKDVIRDALMPFIASPEVSLIVQEVNSFKVTVVGEVKTPGRYELKSAATVLDLLALAGGFTDFARRDGILILRREGDAARPLRFDYTKVGRRRGAAGNPPVRPGDIILVP
jgi:lipopolysaccharide/colanic/teichoic acid biosynthesis glycosyltransferase/protein involved in polysaccharide export with SLBB domain